MNQDTDSLIDQKSKDIVKAMEDLDQVAMEKFRIKKEIIKAEEAVTELKKELTNINESLRQARFCIDRNREEKSSLIRQFWKDKQ